VKYVCEIAFIICFLNGKNLARVSDVTIAGVVTKLGPRLHSAGLGNTIHCSAFLI
jgi:hypothetical protein